MKQLRLDKYLGDCGMGTRSEIKSMIKHGRVTVDGVTVKAIVKVCPETAVVCADGVPIRYQRYYYVMMNKPVGVISATETEGGHEPTVIGLLDERHRGLGLFPVGRLDKDTTGLLILTNDGKFAHNTLSPKKHVAKTYRAEVRGTVTQETAAAFTTGITLGDGYLCAPAELETINPPANGFSHIEITICEGKYHQVKRMFEAVGMQVLSLKRVRFGGLSLDEGLAPGRYWPLTEAELGVFDVKFG